MHKYSHSFKDQISHTHNGAYVWISCPLIFVWPYRSTKIVHAISLRQQDVPTQADIAHPNHDQKRLPEGSYLEKIGLLPGSICWTQSVCQEVFNSLSSIFFRFKSNAVIFFFKTFLLPRDKKLRYNFNYRDWARSWPK